MAGLFDNIFNQGGGVGGLLAALMNSQESLGAPGWTPGINPQFAQPALPDIRLKPYLDGRNVPVASNPQFQQPNNPQFAPPSLGAIGPSGPQISDNMGATYNPGANVPYNPMQSPQFAPPQNPQFQSPSNPQFQPPTNPQFAPPMGTPDVPNLGNAQYPPQLNMFGMTPQAGNEDTGLNMSAPAPQPQATQPDPWAGIRGVNEQPPSIGGGQALLPRVAVQTQGPIPPQLQQQSSPDFGDRLSAGFMGMTNARSPMQALGNLVGGLTTGQRSDAQGMQQQQQSATFKALVARGVPQSEAMAATLNPDIMKIVGAKYFDTQTKLQKTGTDPLSGQDSFSIFKSSQGTLTPIVPGGGSSSGGAPTPTLLAPGVKGIDHTLTGDAYLQQFSPEVQSAVKSYISGDTMPSGNPRQNGIANIAKTIAQKYGQDTGTPVSDALYSQRRTFRTQLASGSASSIGGQAKAFNQGIEHMGALAETLEKLGNWNGLGIPAIAGAANSVRQGMSTEQSAIADKASSIGQTLAGEVGKLFSGSQGGGIHERQATMERFSTVKSQPQLAAALEATLEVMRGGLTALEQRRDEVMGPNSNVKFITEDTENKIHKIEETIQRLKGGAPARQSGGIPSNNDPLGLR